MALKHDKATWSGNRALNLPNKNPSNMKTISLLSAITYLFIFSTGQLLAQETAIIKKYDAEANKVLIGIHPDGFVLGGSEKNRVYLSSVNHSGDESKMLTTGDQFPEDIELSHTHDGVMTLIGQSFDYRKSNSLFTGVTLDVSTGETVSAHRSLFTVASEMEPAVYTATSPDGKYIGLLVLEKKGNPSAIKYRPLLYVYTASMELVWKREFEYGKLGIQPISKVGLDNKTNFYFLNEIPGSGFNYDQKSYAVTCYNSDYAMSDTIQNIHVSNINLLITEEHVTLAGFSRTDIKKTEYTNGAFLIELKLKTLEQQLRKETPLAKSTLYKFTYEKPDQDDVYNGYGIKDLKAYATLFELNNGTTAIVARRYEYEKNNMIKRLCSIYIVFYDKEGNFSEQVIRLTQDFGPNVYQFGQYFVASNGTSLRILFNDSAKNKDIIDNNNPIDFVADAQSVLPADAATFVVTVLPGQPPKRAIAFTHAADSFVMTNAISNDGTYWYLRGSSTLRPPAYRAPQPSMLLQVSE